MKKRFLFGLLAVGTLAGGLMVGCQKKDGTADITAENTIEDTTSLEVIDWVAMASESAERNYVEPPKPNRITLMSLGDCLMHMGVVKSGEQADGSYNYDFLFREIQPALESADIKVINQETIFGGNDRGFSGYPAFNSPTQVGDAIVKAGFNVVLHATNHADDMGLLGIENAIAYWNTQPSVTMVGIGPQTDIPILTIEDTTFALLNYTYSVNTEVIPGNVVNQVNWLCNYDPGSLQLDFNTIRPQVLEDIRKADEIADVVIVFPHWGIEYTLTETSVQDQMAQQMADAGADLIIGTHPHVPEPVKWLEGANGNPCLCYFSLGNFVSTQQDTPRMLGGMAWVTFEKTADEVSIVKEDSGVIPVVTHYSGGPTRVETTYFLENYTAEKAAAHGVNAYANCTLDRLNEIARQVFGEYLMTVEEALQTKDNAEGSDAWNYTKITILD